jgi:peptide/nickel transport system permease protein
VRTHLLQKLVQLVVVLLAVSFLTFLLTDMLPGGPENAILGPNATPEAIEQLRADLRLDDPLIVRYVRWAGDVVQGDFGDSYVQRLPIRTLLAERLPRSLELMVAAQVLALAVAIPLGIAAAYRAGGWLDRVASTTAFGLLSVPNFILAVLLVFFFALGGFAIGGRNVGFSAFPSTGLVPWGESPYEHLRSLVLPALALGAGQIAIYMRLLRTDMVATLQEDFIATARAKGMPTRRVLFRHALKPSSFSLLTVAGLNVGALIGGAVIIESIFVFGGIGDLIVRSIFTRDYLTIQAGVLVVAAGFVIVNFIVDLLYSVLDPRIRHAPAAV